MRRINKFVGQPAKDSVRLAGKPCSICMRQKHHTLFVDKINTNELFVVNWCRYAFIQWNLITALPAKTFSGL